MKVDDYSFKKISNKNMMTGGILLSTLKLVPTTFIATLILA